tara:strand:+ start:464 stop:931 length:468 start_codon:yes stop_codon:yes gene_type:complete
MKGYIYRIFCLNNDIKECYIGSTWDIKVRMKKHKYACSNINSASYNFKVYSFIRANGNWENWDYEYYEVEVIDKTDLGMQEQDRMDIEINILLNDRRAYTDMVEYMKQHYIDNKETIRLRQDKKYNCECGGKYTHSNKARHFKSPKHQDYLKNLN